MQAYERVQAFEAEKKKGLESVLKETEGLRKIQSDIKCIEVDLIAKIESCTKGAQDIQKKIKHWDHELTLLREAQSQDDEFDMSDDENDVSEPKENVNDENDSDDVVMDDVSSDGKNVENVTKSPTGESSLPVFNECALEQYDISEVTDEIASLEKERDSIAKNANMAAIAEYRKKESDYLAR
jgi:structural maintenance of chromosome 4